MKKYQLGLESLAVHCLNKSKGFYASFQPASTKFTWTNASHNRKLNPSYEDSHLSTNTPQNTAYFLCSKTKGK